MGRKIEYYLISKKSIKRPGTKNFVRGIDDDGNVANFVETEQIIDYGPFVFSNVSTRGSVPIFWQSKSFNGEFNIARTQESTMPAFTRHINSLKSRYRRIVCVNLIKNSNSNETKITELFENMVKSTKNDWLKYLYYDKSATKSSSNLTDILTIIKSQISNFGFYAEDVRTGIVLCQQEGVFRYNCTDCLERTNNIQMYSAILAIESMMERISINLELAFGDFPINHLQSSSASSNKIPFIYSFREIWKENLIMLAKLYSSSRNAAELKSKSKMNFKDLFSKGVKSIEKLYIGNFEEGLKNMCLNKILNQSKSQNGESSLMQRSNAIDHEEISIYIMTWNVDGMDPKNCQSIPFRYQENPSLIVICLQGVEKKALSSIEKLKTSWTQIISESISLFGEYKLISTDLRFGNFVLIFGGKNLANRVTSIENSEFKFSNLYQGKGAVVTKLDIDDTSFCFINVGLPFSNIKNTQEKLDFIDEVHQKAFQTKLEKTEKIIENLDYRFLLGSFNFPNTMKNDELKLAIEAYQHEESKDQKLLILQTLFNSDFIESTKSQSSINNYNEFSIVFPPNYKYKLGTLNYDYSKKERYPSWSDRIFFWPSEQYISKQLFYDCLDLKNVTHRPIVALFKLEVSKIKEDLKAEIIESLPDIEEEGDLNSIN